MIDGLFSSRGAISFIKDVKLVLKVADIDGLSFLSSLEIRFGGRAKSRSPELLVVGHSFK